MRDNFLLVPADLTTCRYLLPAEKTVAGHGLASGASIAAGGLGRFSLLSRAALALLLSDNPVTGTWPCRQQSTRACPTAESRSLGGRRKHSQKTMFLGVLDPLAGSK